MNKLLINLPKLKYLLVITCLFLIYSCGQKKDVQLPPAVDIKFAYLNGTDVFEFAPQSEIFHQQLKDQLILKVTEENLDKNVSDSDLLKQSYAIPFETLQDKEVFVTRQNARTLTSFAGLIDGQYDFSFTLIVPIQITDQIVPNNGVLEISPGNDEFIKAVYTSSYSGLNVERIIKVK